MKSNAIAVGLLLVTITVAGVSSRFSRVCCPVCHHQVFVLSPVEKHFGPFKDIPCIHPECADYIKRVLAPEEGKDMNEWLKDRGYYYSKEQMRNIGVVPVVQDPQLEHRSKFKDGVKISETSD